MQSKNCPFEGSLLVEVWVSLLLALESEVTFPTYFEVLHTSFFDLKKTLPIFKS
jgi:hypothetical protein